MCMQQGRLRAGMRTTPNVPTSSHTHSAGVRISGRDGAARVRCNSSRQGEGQSSHTEPMNLHAPSRCATLQRVERVHRLRARGLSGAMPLRHHAACLLRNDHVQSFRNRLQTGTSMCRERRSIALGDVYAENLEPEYAGAQRALP